MGFFGRLFPYSNLHDLNLDWIMQQIQDLQEGSAEALAQILAQGVSGTEFHWAATLDELIVRDAQDQEIYRIKWDGDGFTLTQAGGTPLTYRVSSGTLTAPTVNGTVIRGGSAAITGDVACGSATVAGTVTCGTITPSTPVDIVHGGTGATTAAAARTALGAMAADAVIPVAQGGTGATSAAAARTALGAMAADAVIPVAQGGTGATSAAAARTALGAMAADAVIPIAQGGTGATSADAAVANLGFEITRKDQPSGSLVGLVGGRGTWLVTVLDGGDDTKYFVGVIFHANNSTAPTGTTIANNGITFSYGNAIGTCVFAGATGNYIAKAIKLTV